MKTYAQYLAEHDGNSATAAAAMEKDLHAELARLNAAAGAERGENFSAREQARKFRKLLADGLGVDVDGLEREGATREERLAALDQVIKEATAQVAAHRELSGILTGAGFDVAEFQRAGRERRTELSGAFTQAVTAGQAKAAELEQRLNLRDAADELRVDPKRLAALRGTDTLQRVTVEEAVTDEDGNTTTRQRTTWQVLGGTELTAHLAALGFTPDQLRISVSADPDAENEGAPVVGAQARAAATTDASDMSWLK